MIPQLTVFISNDKGRLSAMCRVLADADINMMALFIADTADYGVARVFCSEPDRAVEALRAAGYRASIAQVIGVRVSDEKGSFAALLEFMDTLDVNIEYAYCFSIREDFALDALKVDIDEAPAVEQALRDAGYFVATFASAAELVEGWR